ncbi:Hypothetical predicted protein [Mytilus galloprovincialis]|uniref:Fibronectin type-III domain-containing protein n=1 Tax=Mytilus galloprovincialis TaxID=29158 RepID=A0A8B6E9R6_MYTGA|nr:Hypothetical predicted protein [Mytilus galloprovincialis]
MTCIKTLQSVVVRSGDSLILNCTCFNRSNGILIGPNNIPYTQGTVLNPILNKSKYEVFGGYDVNKCYLKITNVLPDDDGAYVCHYISSDTVHIDIYNVVTTDLPEPPENLTAVFNSIIIVVHWQPGLDGGHPQQFYIEYRPETRSEWEVVGPISQSNFTIEQELKYTLNYILFAKKYYIRMYADNVVGQSNYTHLFCVDMEGKMPCIEVKKALFVTAGEDLTLYCSCFNKTNGQWSGPNKQLLLNSNVGKWIPYALGIELNPKLNKSKYRIYGGYDVKQCNLVITNFLKEDDGTYTCQYIMNKVPSTVFLHIYYIVATSMPHSYKSLQSIQWMLPLVAIMIICIAVTAFLLWLRKVRVEENGNGHSGIISQGTRPQIHEISMNYSEVMFDVHPSTNRLIIHGNDERTVYSEVDHAIKAEPLPSSSSESDDD